ncbi:MAG: hypothetical protein SVY41_01430, partial [Candidatus Nanohaloarchaea archaeon]|nr:hypothetical protein [Candidatus Nanohaloarchaea archaeon]
ADDIDFTRRETAGSVINCDASATYFSFIVPAAPGDYKTDLNAEYGPALRDTVVAMGLDPVQTRIADRGGVKMRRTHDEPYRAGIGACQVARDSAALYHGAVYLEPPTDVDRHVDLRSTGGEDEASFVQEFFGIADALDMSPETARQQFATELPSHVPGDYEKFQLSLPARTPSSPSPRRNTAVTGGGAGTVPEPRYGAGSACVLSTRTMTGSTELPALLCRGNLREGPRTAAAPLPG